MVTGFAKFKEWFQGFENQYVIIGGTACDLLMENEDMSFRATKDIAIEGIPVLSADCLIPFKAKAWLDLRERKANGEAVDSKNIKKHKNDVFRLAQLMSADSRKQLDDEIANDMKHFLTEIREEPIDLKSLGIRGVTFESMLTLLRRYYGIEE